jgi:hypothetical protein
VGYWRESERRAKQAAATGVITGAIIGGALGALAGGDENRTEAAATGAILGGIVGGFGNYYREKQRQYTEDQARFAAYAQDVGHAIEQADRIVAAARTAQKCYRVEFKGLLAAKRRGYVSDQEGRAQFAEILSGLNETNALLASVNQQFGENLQVYTQAYEEDLRQTGYTREEVARAVVADPKYVREIPPAPRKPRKPPPKVKVPDPIKKTEAKLIRAKYTHAKVSDEAEAVTAERRAACNEPAAREWVTPELCPGVSSTRI